MFGIVRAVHDLVIILLVHGCLPVGTEFRNEEFGRVGGRTRQSTCDIRYIGDDGRNKRNVYQ